MSQAAQHKPKPVTGTAPADWHLLDASISNGGAPHNIAALKAALKHVPPAMPGRLYWTGPINGQWSPNLTVAIGQFQRDYGLRQTTVIRPGDETEKALLKLLPPKFKRMKGVAGTNSVIVYQNNVLPGRLMGDKLKVLDSHRRNLLANVKSALTRQFKIKFDVSVRASRENPEIIVARFFPIDFDAYIDGAWHAKIQDLKLVDRALGPIRQRMADSIKANTKNIANLKIPSDRNYQAKLKDQLVTVVLSQADTVRQKYDRYLEAGKKNPHKFAYRLLVHYLSAKGTPITIFRKEAMSLKVVERAVAANIERIKEKNFLDPDPSNPAYQALSKLSHTKNGGAAFWDEWKYDISIGKSKGVSRMVQALFDSGSWDNVESYFLGAGSSSIRTIGRFSLTRKSDRVIVLGTVEHVWEDPAYNFNIGSLFERDTKILESAGFAKKFKWHAAWRDQVQGELKVRSDSWTRSKNPISSHGLEWVSFTMTPIS